MTVYVDNMRRPWGRLVMCHLLADTDDELLAMVDLIGVDRKWHQHPGTDRSHFDIALSKRALAVQSGAVEITMKQCGAMRARRRHTGDLGDPEGALDWLKTKFREELRDIEEESR